VEPSLTPFAAKLAPVTSRFCEPACCSSHLPKEMKAKARTAADICEQKHFQSDTMLLS
jgi:hypothetical protein